MVQNNNYRNLKNTSVRFDFEEKTLYVKGNSMENINEYLELICKTSENINEERLKFDLNNKKIKICDLNK